MNTGSFRYNLKQKWVNSKPGGGFQVTDKYSPWFPEYGAMNVKDWDKVGSDLKRAQEGHNIPVSAWSVWSAVKTALEPLHTEEEKEEFQDDIGKLNNQESNYQLSEP
ncbi:PREDICTED: HERV-K_3q21.2 provirus ancestral Gag polyprotein [Cercocebus atys]|uniref:HERV-K_3q21.2 provirus ancestral Gag polyprotein n=1 Tax=Cercocebus atys TaxID=9531 RepID=UPI0005F4E6E5|nr:PREDICTED: HERV-K_3q21.2 provirus ancestral Gag polyprotein [Cercocebus atys]